MAETPFYDDLAHQPLDSQTLSAREAQALVRLIEAGHSVVLRSQFFVWMRTHVHMLLPHAASVCGSYSRQRQQLQFKVFNSVVLPAPLLEELGAEGSPLLQCATQQWADGGGHAFTDLIDGPASPWAGLHAAGQLAERGLRHALVHGVCRPERPHELETFFLLLNDRAYDGTHKIELLVPQLHANYLRSVMTHRAVAPMAARAALPLPHRLAPPVTDRELQILHWVREGKSNQDIAQLLDISVLTVKNHIHKILGKLGANNRAHAVTLVVRLGLLPSAPQRLSDGA